MDLKAAFDSVNRRILLESMKERGTREVVRKGKGGTERDEK